MVVPRRTQAERRARSEQSLLEAAEQLIAEKGTSRTTLAEIGERAGYSRGLVNQRFGSKGDLVSQLTQRIQKRFRDGILVPALEDRTGLDALLTAVDAYLAGMDLSAGAGRAFYVLMAESLGPVPEIRETFATANREFRAFVERRIKDGIEAGDIRSDIDLAAQSGMIVGALRGITLQWLVDPNGLDLRATSRELRQTLERSLRTRTE
jgi:AcrR family transcriptional regulator